LDSDAENEDPISYTENSISTVSHIWNLSILWLRPNNQTTSCINPKPLCSCASKHTEPYRLQQIHVRVVRTCTSRSLYQTWQTPTEWHHWSLSNAVWMGPCSIGWLAEGPVPNLTKSKAVQHLVHFTSSQSLCTRTSVLTHSRKIQHHHSGPLIPSPTKFNTTFIKFGTKPAQTSQNLLLESDWFGVVRVNACAYGKLL
jgi:hypothetical protein